MEVKMKAEACVEEAAVGHVAHADAEDNSAMKEARGGTRRSEATRIECEAAQGDHRTLQRMRCSGVKGTFFFNALNEHYWCEYSIASVKYRISYRIRCISMVCGVQYAVNSIGWCMNENRSSRIKHRLDCCCRKKKKGGGRGEGGGLAYETRRLERSVK
jgi:hypothetical protein